MNDLVTQRDQLPARPKGAAPVLAQIDAMVAPVRAVPWDYRSGREVMRLSHPTVAMGERSGREVLALGIDPRTLTEFGRELDQAIDGDRDTQRLKVILGLLIDAFLGNRPPNLNTFLDTALQHVQAKGYTPTVIALAKESLEGSSRFVPSISEILDACGKAKADLENKRTLNTRVLQGLERARAALDRSPTESEPPRFC